MAILGCGGYTVFYGLRWQDTFPKCLEFLEALLLDQVQLLGLSVQHEISAFLELKIAGFRCHLNYS